MSKHKVQVRRVYDDPPRGREPRTGGSDLAARHDQRESGARRGGARRSRHPPSCARGITTTRNVSPSSPAATTTN